MSAAPVDSKDPTATEYKPMETAAAEPVVQASAVPVPMQVDVIAPSDMPGGYQFHVDVDGRNALVIVVRA